VGFRSAVWYRSGRGDLGRRSYARRTESRLSEGINITIVRGTVRASSVVPTLNYGRDYQGGHLWMSCYWGKVTKLVGTI
jgi:hypothetical protein